MKKRFFDSGLYSLISSRQYLGLYCFNFWQEIFPLMGKLVLFESHFSAFSAIHATEILQASMGLSNIPKLQTSRRHYGPLFVPSKWRKKLDFQIKKRYQLKVLWIVSDSILKHKAKLALHLNEVQPTLLTVRVLLKGLSLLDPKTVALQEEKLSN